MSEKKTPAKKTTTRKTAAKPKKPEAEKKPVGRPLKFKTPEELKSAIDSFFAECLENGDIPLISWMEHKLGFRFYDYEAREEFSKVTTWAREESQAICEQKAFKGQMSKIAARLYLSCRCGYIQEKKVSVEANTKISAETVTNIIAEVDNLDPEKQKYFDELLRKRTEDGENS